MNDFFGRFTGELGKNVMVFSEKAAKAKEAKVKANE
jgi:hypothetical protein